MTNPDSGSADEADLDTPKKKKDCTALPGLRDRYQKDERENKKVRAHTRAWRKARDSPVHLGSSCGSSL